MKPVEYPEDFLNSKMCKKHLSELISKLEDSSIQINMEDILGNSKTKTMLQVYEASKKLSRKRNKESKQLGDELSNMVKECFADYTKLYESTSIKKTMGSETSKAKKTLFEKLKSSSGKAVTSIKKKKKVIDLKRSLRAGEYEDAVEIALELNSIEASDILIDKVNSFLKYEKFDVQNVYTLLKGADDILTNNNQSKEKLNNLIKEVIYRAQHKFLDKTNNIETLHKLTLKDSFNEVWDEEKLIYFRIESKRDMNYNEGKNSFIINHTYDELKKIIDLSLKGDDFTREEALFIANKSIQLFNKAVVLPLNTTYPRTFTSLTDSDKREIILKIPDYMEISPAVKKTYGLELLSTYNEKLLTESEKELLFQVKKINYFKHFQDDMKYFNPYYNSDAGSKFIGRKTNEILGINNDEQFDFVMKLIEKRDFGFVINFIEHFKGIKPEQHKEIVLAIIKNTTQLKNLCLKFEKFTGIKKEDHEEILLKIIEKSKESAYISSYYIDNFEKFYGIPKNKYEFFLLKMIEVGNAHNALKQFKKFNGQTQEEIKQINLNHENIVNKLIEKGKISELCFFFQEFNIPESRHEHIISEVIKGNYELYNIIQYFEKFTGYPKEKHEELLSYLISNTSHSSDACYSAVYSLKKFTGIPKERYFDILSRLIYNGNSNTCEAILKKINSFDLSKYEKFYIYAEIIIQKGTKNEEMVNSTVNLFFNEIEKFNENDKLFIINHLYKEENSSLSSEFILTHIEKFNLSDKNKNEITLKTFEKILQLEDNYNYLVNLFESKQHEKFNFDAIQRIYNLNTLYSKKLFVRVARKKDLINIYGEEKVNLFMQSLPNGEERRNAFTLNKYDRTSRFLFYLHGLNLFEHNKQEFEIVTDYVKRFSLSETTKLYTYFRDLKLLEMGLIKELPKQQIKDKMTSLDLLENKFKNLNKIVYGEEPLLGENLKKYSEFELELLNKTTGKSTHKFNSGRPTFEKLISDYISYSSTSDFKEGLALAKKYNVLNIKAHLPNISFNKSLIEKDYLKLRGDILLSLDSTKSSEEKLNSQKEICVMKIESKLNEVIELNKTKPNDFLQKQIEFYTSLKVEVNNSKTFDDVLFSLLKIDRGTIEKLDLTQQLRFIVLYKISEKNYTSDQALSSIESDLTLELTSNSVLSVINIIDNFAKEHVLNLNNKNQEKYWDEQTWESILESKKNSKKINLLKIFNPYVDNLKKESEKFVVENEGNSFNVSCIPDRGFVGEMSGYLANVCYTAETEMLRRYSNLIPYKFVVDGNEGKRFIGSVLIFELNSKHGEKVALLRALDIPKEDEINIPEFIESFISSITPSIQKRDITKIIVPGNDHAISNYYMTLNHFAKYKKPENKITLSSKFDFNGYNITDDCYVVRTI